MPSPVRDSEVRDPTLLNSRFLAVKKVLWWTARQEFATVQRDAILNPYFARPFVQLLDILAVACGLGLGLGRLDLCLSSTENNGPI